jgi:hypothetical protein
VARIVRTAWELGATDEDSQLRSAADAVTEALWGDAEEK